MRNTLPTTWFMSFLILIATGFWSPTASAGKQSDRNTQIRVTLSKEKLLLGVETSLNMTMHLPRNKELHKFNFQALLGDVSDVQVTPNGRKIHAIYTPPKQFYPAVDLVVVSASDGNTTFWGFTTVKLIGQGKAQIETTPQATTYLRIGSRKFGPVTADQDGVAFVDVEVPPGVTYGIDDEGNEVPLHLPQGPRAAIFAARGPQINLDETSTEDFLLVFWTPEGKADSEIESPSVTAEAGQLSAATELSSGIFEMRYRVPEKPGAVKFAIYDDAQQHVHSQSIEMVGTEDFRETAVTIEKKEEVKKEPKPAVAPKTEPPSVGAYRIFLSGAAGYTANFSTWNAPVGKIGVAFRIPAKPILGIGIQVGCEYDKVSAIQRPDYAEPYPVESKTMMVPVTALFYYRVPMRPLWYVTPGVELGVKVVADLGTTGSGNKGIDTLPAITGGANLALERVLGPGMIYSQLSVNFISSHLTGVKGTTPLGELLIGYKLAFGEPR
ncbi:MAG: hypothetical protein JXX14_06780 [Deltaproteobacteria bacterium]|nr:hypothetical protein [Deltaproteobacteria bacterium]